MKKQEIIEKVSQGNPITVFRGAARMKPSATICGETIRLDVALKVIRELNLSRQGQPSDFTNNYI